MGDSIRSFRCSFGALTFIGVIWFLFVVVMANHASNVASSRVTAPSTVNSRQWRLIGSQKLAVFQNLNLNIVSKRRVPNGPDPIHNRGASKTRQPPTRA